MSARYGTQYSPVLYNLSFVVMSGEKVGIIGRSGSGKSSLIKVLWRALVPFEGKVLVDGVDISKRDLKDFRRQIMVVTQEAALFEGSLKMNINPLLQKGKGQKNDQNSKES